MTASLESDDQASVRLEDGQEGSGQAPRRRRTAYLARHAALVSVLPPSRPDLGQPAAPAQAEPLRPEPVVAATAQPDALRPSLSGDAPPADPAQVAAAPDPSPDDTVGLRVVSLQPPSRPAFPWDGGNLQSANLTIDAVTTRGPGGGFVEILPPARPAFRRDVEPSLEANAAPDAVLPDPPAQPEQKSLFGRIFGTVQSTATAVPRALINSGHAAIDALIALHARANGVPEDLVHRVVVRESKYNPQAVGGRGAYLGLMQISHSTARSLGYEGPPTGLLDPNTNLTYAVKYLAGAYRTAGGNYDRAVGYYARGYYYAAKKRAKIADRRRTHARLEANAQP